MTEPIMLSIIGGVVTIMVAYMEKMRRDVKSTRVDSAAVHASINNRTDKDGNPISLSDRIDGVMSAVKDVADRVDGHSKDLRGFRQDVGELRGEDRDIRAQLQEHVKQTAPMIPMLEDLHARYAGNQRDN